MDIITIKDLEVYCHHGVLKEETVLGQKFLVTAELYTDVKKAAKTDDLTYAINYADVSHFIESYMKEHTFRLIETVAEQLAQEILLEFPLVLKVKVMVKKPWAPILLPLDTVSVMVEREWSQVYISVGSNLGDKEANINSALEKLKSDDRIRDFIVSSFYQTKPYGYLEQDDFINAAISFQTLYSPDELLEVIRQIEKEGGRERTIHWGPRTIDLDILLYDDKIIQTKDLIIPHPEMHLREFVLKPLAEIAPWATHPVLGKTIYALQGELSDD